LFQGIGRGEDRGEGRGGRHDVECINNTGDEDNI